jgi:hypothetical protein
MIGFGVLLCGTIGYFVGRTKGRAWLGALFAVLLGPVGLVIVLLLPDPLSTK